MLGNLKSSCVFRTKATYLAIERARCAKLREDEVCGQPFGFCLQVARGPVARPRPLFDAPHQLGAQRIEDDVTGEFEGRDCLFQPALLQSDLAIRGQRGRARD